MIQKYRNHILLLLLVSILLPNCAKEVNTNSPILKEAKMVEVLKILFLTEVKTIDTYELSIQKNKYIEQYVYPELFDSLGVKSADFYQSYNYYTEHPAELTKLLDLVIAAIDSMKVDRVVFPPDKKSLEESYREIHALEQLKEQKRMDRYRPTDNN